MPYIGNSPGTGTRNRFIYTATASQTTFSGADDNGKTLKYADSDYVDVYLNGICLVPVTDYTSTSKTSIVLTQAASLNDTLEVVAYDIATISDTVSKADGGTFNDGITITTADNTTQLTLESTDADASVGPVLDLYRNSSSPAADDLSGMIRFLGQDSAGNQQEYAKLRAQIKDPTSGSEDTLLSLQTFVGGSGRERMLITPTETNFNDDGVDLDFRVESDNNANMLFVDAGADRVRIGTTSQPHGTANVTFEAADMAMCGQPFFSGKVANTTNDNSGFVRIFDLDYANTNNVGLMFDGFIYFQSYTGYAMAHVSISKHYINDTINHVVHESQDGFAAVSGVDVRLVTATVGSTSYLGFQKFGGGTGAGYINAAIFGTADTINVREERSADYTVTTNHGTIV